MKQFLPITVYHRLKYFKNFKKLPNLSKPSTITEILLSNIVNGKINNYYQLADKLYIKEYSIKKLKEDISIPTLAVWDCVENIDISQLPKRFVIKTNNSCGTNYFCYDKAYFDLEKCKQQIKEWLLIDYGRINGEPHYNLIKPKIFAEEFLENVDQLYDYKFFCFFGKSYFVQVIDRGKKEQCFYDMSWKKINLKFISSNLNSEGFKKPKNFKKMISIANTLSKEIDFCRVDLYNQEGKIYLGEVTLTPKGGYLHFSPDYLNKEFGEIYYKEMENNK